MCVWSSIGFGSVDYYRTRFGTHRLALFKNTKQTIHSLTTKRQRKKGCVPLSFVFFVVEDVAYCLLLLCRFAAAVAVTCLRGGLPNRERSVAHWVER